MDTQDTEKLAAKIQRIQWSTRTFFPAFIRVHNWLRMKSRIYYRWHMSPMHTAVHLFVLLTYTLGTAASLYHLATDIPAVNATNEPTAYDLATTSNYHLRIDGAAATDGLGLRGLAVGDLNNNGKSDLVIISPYTDFNSRSNSGSMYIILDTELSNITGMGNKIDLSDTSKYALRFDLPQSLSFVNMSDTTSDMMQNVMVSDYNGDGKDDILLPLTSADIGVANTGSLYFISNTLINQHLEVSTTIDLANAETYTLRIDGKNSGDSLGVFANLHDKVDYDSDGKNDLFVGPGLEDITGTNSGSLYLINSSLLANYTGAGNTLDLNDPSKFNIRYDGEGDINGLGSDSVIAADVNGNGKNDLILGSSFARFNERVTSGSIHIIYDDLLSSYTGTGNIVQLPNSGTYSLRIDGPAVSTTIGRFAMAIDDLDGDGRLDIAAGGYQAANNGSRSGSAWIIPGSILDDYPERGSKIDLLDSSKYWLRIDGSSAEKLLTYNNLASGDFNNDGKNDLLIGMHRNNENGRADSGSAYMIDSSTLRSYTGTGNTFNMSAPTKYQFRWDSAAAGDRLVTTTYNLRDVNSDGINDLWLNSYYADNNGRTDSGSLYFIFLFPHSIATPTVSGDTVSMSRTVTGSVTATSSLSAIATVQASLNTASFSGDWVDCAATDGAFDSKSESYSCGLELPSTGTHTIRIRAKDSMGVYTPTRKYASVRATYELPASPGPSPTPTPEATPTPDTTEPSLSLNTISGILYKTAYKTFSYYSQRPRPVFAGTTEASATVKVLSGDAGLCTATADSTGAWTCTSSLLEHKDYEIEVVATDSANNETRFPKFTLRISASAPTSKASPATTTETTPTPVAVELDKSTTSDQEGVYTTIVARKNGVIMLEKLQTRLTDKAGKPIPHAQVTLYSEPQTATSDYNGIVTFRDVAVGEHTLEYIQGKTKIRVPVKLALSEEVEASLSEADAVEITLSPIEIELPLRGIGIATILWMMVVFLSVTIGGYVGYIRANKLYPHTPHHHASPEMIEKELMLIQKSTSTSWPGFIRIHNWLRMHLRDYYWWHLLPGYRLWLVGLFALYIVFLVIVMSRMF